MRLGYLVLGLAALCARGSDEGPIEWEMLKAHNHLRERVGVAPLEWSDKLASAAQAWADTLHQRRQLLHEPKLKYGQNLYTMQGGSVSASEVVKAWAAEETAYDPRTNKCKGACGHFTQIVWYSTKRVGCAVARGGGREVWVCDYDPPGNYIGQRPY